MVSALAAVGGVVWTKGENGQLALQYQVNLQQTGLIESEEKQKSHSRLLYKLLIPRTWRRSGALVPPHSGFGDDEAANPTEFLLIFAALRTDLEMVGLMEIFQRAETTAQVQQGYLRFLLADVQTGGRFPQEPPVAAVLRSPGPVGPAGRFHPQRTFLAGPIETAYTIANEARRLIECDRVSVAIRKGNRCTIEAISGQDIFDKRSNTVELLGRLASAVVATGEPVWYAGDTPTWPRRWKTRCRSMSTTPIRR